jgi:hypothetical protein
MSENLDMWDFWLDKRGSPSDALEADYPELLKSDISLQISLSHVKMGQASIDRLMRLAADKSEGDGLSGILGTPIGYGRD